MKETSNIIIMESEVLNDKSRLVIPKSQRNKLNNENEAIVDGLGRIQLAKSIRERMKIKEGDKLEIYVSGKNIILKKLKHKESISRESKVIIENKYEIKITINEIDFNAKHKITTIDEIGNILIWREIREELGIIEKDKIKICIKDDMIILIKKERDNYRRKKYPNYNRRSNKRFYK